MEQTVSNQQSTANKQEKEILRINNFSFRLLTKQSQQQAIQLLGRQFHKQQPLSFSYTKKHPHNPSSEQSWFNFFNVFMDDAASNNLSTAVFDTDCNKLAAVFICRDITYVPQRFFQTFCGEKQLPHTFILELQNVLRNQLKTDLNDFLNQKGKIVDFWGVAIDEAYTGTKILFKNMLAIVQNLAKEGGYTHGHIYAVNEKTNIVAKKANYELISRVRAKQIVLRGQQPFSEVQEFHNNPSLWLKKL